MRPEINPTSRTAIKNNDAALLKIRHSVSLAAGCAAGALRLEFLYGLAFYVLTCVVTGLTIIIASHNPGSYFTNPIKSLSLGGVMTSFPGYVLAWSFVYSLVET